MANNKQSGLEWLLSPTTITAQRTDANLQLCTRSHLSHELLTATAMETINSRGTKITPKINEYLHRLVYRAVRDVQDHNPELRQLSRRQFLETPEYKACFGAFVDDIARMSFVSPRQRKQFVANIEACGLFTPANLARLNNKSMKHAMTDVQAREFADWTEQAQMRAAEKHAKKITTRLKKGYDALVHRLKGSPFTAEQLKEEEEFLQSLEESNFHDIDKKTTAPAATPDAKNAAAELAIEVPNAPHKAASQTTKRSATVLKERKPAAMRAANATEGWIEIASKHKGKAAVAAAGVAGLSYAATVVTGKRNQNFEPNER